MYLTLYEYSEGSGVLAYPAISIPTGLCIPREAAK